MGLLADTGKNFFHKIGSFFGLNNDKYFFDSVQSYRIGYKGAVYLDTDIPKNLFDTIPQLNQVITKKANMFANMRLVLVDKDGNEVEDPNFQKFIENPNILQTQNEFLKLWSKQVDVYGNLFCYKSQASKLQAYPTSVNLVSPFNISPVLTGKIYDQTELSGIIEKYETRNNLSQKEFPTQDILWVKNADLDDPTIGISPLRSLKFPLSNTKLAYDYLNVISNEKGAIGILSKENSKDSFGAIPMTQDEKKSLEAAFQDSYGLGQSIDGTNKMRVQITESAMKWEPMTYPTKDLLLMEQIDANFLTIIDHYGMNVNIFSSKSQTYENVTGAIRQCYQDTIFVCADEFTQAFGKFIGVKEGLTLKADYSHLPIFQTDESAKAADLKTKIDSITQLVQSNIITPLQAQQIMQTELALTFDNVGNTTLDKLNLVSPLVANSILSKVTINEGRALVGLPKITGGDVIEQPKAQF